MTHVNKPLIKLKKQLCDTTLLVHFDKKRPIILSTDASSYGIGAVIMHRYLDGTEKTDSTRIKNFNRSRKNNTAKSRRKPYRLYLVYKNFINILLGLNLN